MTCSHSLFVAKLARGTVPHGIAHIRLSLGHLTLHEHSAVAVAAEVTTENTIRSPANRSLTAPPPPANAASTRCKRVRD